MSFLKKYTIPLIYLIATIISIPFFIGFGFDTVPPLSYGLEYDQVSYSIDRDTLHKGCRKWTGIKHKFISFPITQQVIVFSDNHIVEDMKGSYYEPIYCRTKEGLFVKISLFVSYKLTVPTDQTTDKDLANQLADIYEKFEMDWNKFLFLLTISYVKNIVALYDLDSFYTERANINNKIQSSLRTPFAQKNFELKSAQLIGINIDSSLQNAIQDTQFVRQTIQAKSYLKESKIIEKEKSLQIATDNSKIKLINETAKADAILTEQKGLAEILSSVATQKSEGLKEVLAQFSGNQELLLDLLWIYYLREMKNLKIAVKTPVDINTLF